MRSLNELGAPDVQPSRQDEGDGSNAHRRLELAKWLSDWHLLSFLGTSGLLSEADAKVFIRVATLPNMENNPAVLDALLETESWQTLATFARESAPQRPAPDAPPTRIMDDDIPPELFDEVTTPDHGNSRPSANVRVCPHCTFENTNSGNDCEVCGLPL